MKPSEYIHNDQSPIDDGLKLMHQCPLCRQDYAKDGIALLEEKEGVSLVHLECAGCMSSVLAIVMVSQLGMSSVGVITDLSAEDARRFREREIFTQDDVLDFYGCMQKKGVLEQALAPRQRNIQ